MEESCNVASSLSLQHSPDDTTKVQLHTPDGNTESAWVSLETTIKPRGL